MKTRSRSNWKVALAFGAGLLTLLIVGGVSYRLMVGSDEDDRWVQHTRETLGTLDSLLSAQAGIDSSIRGFALSGTTPISRPTAPWHCARMRPKPPFAS